MSRAIFDYATKSLIATIALFTISITIELTTPYPHPLREILPYTSIAAIGTTITTLASFIISAITFTTQKITTTIKTRKQQTNPTPTKTLT